MSTDGDRGPFNEKHMKRRVAQGRTVRLQDQVNHPGLFPTPTVNGNYNKAGASARSGDGLATAVREPYVVVGGGLNPEWVEALMGFPRGWTEVGKKASRAR
jgi:hypothetical protein